MIAYKNKKKTLLYISDENADGETHFVPDISWHAYLRLRLCTPKKTILCNTIQEAYIRSGAYNG